MKFYLLNYGPVAVTVYASETPFIGYKSGVVQCDPSITSLSHEVALVGWDDNDGDNGAWIIKNSWGTNWG